MFSKIGTRRGFPGSNFERASFSKIRQKYSVGSKRQRNVSPATRNRLSKSNRHLLNRHRSILSRKIVPTRNRWRYANLSLSESIHELLFQNSCDLVFGSTIMLPMKTCTCANGRTSSFFFAQERRCFLRTEQKAQLNRQAS